MFHTELNPHWPNLEKLHARERESKLKQQSNFNLRHKATPLTPLEPGIEVHVKDLDRHGVEWKQQKLLVLMRLRHPSAPWEGIACTSHRCQNREKTNWYQLKIRSRRLYKLISTNLHWTHRQRPKPSLKVRENLGLIWHFSDRLCLVTLSKL